MPKDLEPSISERTFVLDALKEGIRIDGRDADAYRALNIDFSTEYGLVEVRLGRTRIMTRISCEIARPFPDKPFEGIFACNTELSPMASASFEAGRSSDEEVVISRLIEKAVRRSRALDTESLCIIAGQKCWAVRADVHFLDHDGGLVDAANIAVIAALLHFRRPDVTVVGEDVTVHPITQKVPVPLSITHIPICITFSFFASGSISLVDATFAEERLREGAMTITMNKNKEIVQIAKAGGISMEAQTLMKCARIALQKTLDITAIIEERVKLDIRRKDERFQGGSAENVREGAEQNYPTG